MSASPWYRDRTLLLVLSASTALKLVLAFLVRHDPAILDEGAYLELAQGLAAGQGFNGTFRPPGYPAFLAFWLWIGAGTLGVRLAQVALSGLSVVLVWRLGERLGGGRVGRVAATVFAFDPILVAFSHRLWSETLFIAILLAAVDLLTADRREPAWGRTALAGVLLGLGSLVRPMLVTALPFLALWMLWEAWQARADGGLRLVPRALRLGLLGGVCLLLIVPWTLRNQRLTGTFILIDSNGPFNFLVGSQPEARFVDKDDVWSDAFGRVDGEAYTELVQVDAARAQAGAMALARAHMTADPRGFVAKCLWEAGHLWTLDSFLLRHLRNHWYGKDVPGWVTPTLTLLSAGWFALLALTGLAGLLLGLDRPLPRLGTLLVLQALCLFGMTYALSRYSVPLHPFLALGAAGLLAGATPLRDRWARTGWAPRITLGLLLLLVASGWMRDLPLLSDMVRNQGAGHRFRMLQRSELPTAP